MSARRLATTDAEAYVALRREMLLDAPWAYLASPGDDRASEVDTLVPQLESSDLALFGGFDEGGALVACAGLVRERPIKRHHIATLWGVYTTPRARGRGLARDVVKHAIEHARTLRSPAIAWVQLSVSDRSTGARALYESLGFVAWGTEPDAVRWADEPGAMEIHMARRLA